MCRDRSLVTLTRLNVVSDRQSHRLELFSRPPFGLSREEPQAADFLIGLLELDPQPAFGFDDPLHFSEGWLFESHKFDPHDNFAELIPSSLRSGAHPANTPSTAHYDAAAGSVEDELQPSADLRLGRTRSPIPPIERSRNTASTVRSQSSIRMRTLCCIGTRTLRLPG